MPEQPIGPILEALGVSFELADGDLVDSAVVLLKVLDVDGRVRLDVENSAGMDWLGQLGIITAATQIITDSPFESSDDA